MPYRWMQQGPPRPVGVERLSCAALVSAGGRGLDERLGHPLLLEEQGVDLSHAEQVWNRIPRVQAEDPPLGDPGEYILATNVDGTQQHRCASFRAWTDQLLADGELRRADTYVDVVVSDSSWSLPDHGPSRCTRWTRPRPPRSSHASRCGRSRSGVIGVLKRRRSWS